MRLRRVALSLVLSTTACAGAAVPESTSAGPPAASSAPPSVWDGVYAATQAERGAAQYAEACSSCHAEDLRGDSNAPSLVGVSFLFVWEGRPLEELFTTVRTRMPTNAPNSLPESTYLDIVAFILERNGYPAGAGAMGADPAVLGRITITASEGGA